MGVRLHSKHEIVRKLGIHIYKDGDWKEAKVLKARWRQNPSVWNAFGSLQGVGPAFATGAPGPGNPGVALLAVEGIESDLEITVTQKEEARGTKILSFDDTKIRVLHERTAYFHEALCG